MSRRRPKENVPAVLEGLEPRNLASGTVNVFFTPGKVTIVGDAVRQAITVGDGGLGTPYTVTASDGTSIATHGASPLSSASVAFILKMGNGGDSVTFSPATAKSVTFTGGTGNDTVIIGGAGTAIAGPVSVNTGAGEATVTIEGATIAGDVSILTGPVDDTIEFGGTEATLISGSVTIKSGRGVDRIRIRTGSYGKMAITTSAVTFGTDYINVGYDGGAGEVTLAALTISGGAGADIVRIATASDADSPVTVTGSTVIKLGPGNNSLEMAMNRSGNAVRFQGNALIDLGPGANVFDVDATGAGSRVTFSGETNTILLGTGFDTTNGIEPGSLHLTSARGMLVSGRQPKSWELLVGISSGYTLDGPPLYFHLDLRNVWT